MSPTAIAETAPAIRVKMSGRVPLTAACLRFVATWYANKAKIQATANKIVLLDSVVMACAISVQKTPGPANPIVGVETAPVTRVKTNGHAPQTVR